MPIYNGDEKSYVVERVSQGYNHKTVKVRIVSAIPIGSESIPVGAVVTVPKNRVTDK